MHFCCSGDGTAGNPILSAIYGAIFFKKDFAPEIRYILRFVAILKQKKVIALKTPIFQIKTPQAKPEIKTPQLHIIIQKRRYAIEKFCAKTPENIPHFRICSHFSAGTLKVGNKHKLLL